MIIKTCTCNLELIIASNEVKHTLLIHAHTAGSQVQLSAIQNHSPSSNESLLLPVTAVDVNYMYKAHVHFVNTHTLPLLAAPKTTT